MVETVFGKNTNFCFFQKIENLWKCFAKISVTKFREWKIWDCYLFSFSAPFAVVYSVFYVDAFFTEKIAKQNRLFLLFFKKAEKRRKVWAETGVKNWKIIFSVASIFDSCPSRSFWTPELLSQPFLRCRNRANIFVEDEKIYLFCEFRTDQNDRILIGQI